MGVLGQSAELFWELTLTEIDACIRAHIGEQRLLKYCTGTVAAAIYNVHRSADPKTRQVPPPVNWTLFFPDEEQQRYQKPSGVLLMSMQIWAEECKAAGRSKHGDKRDTRR